ncbi:MAG: hypothetical protein LUH05_03705 [Candidatus Gastranaerophilales bacterium]|nr:hypothetical protein [Candidatus Gastranaerophilales bacterium]
MSDTTKNLSLYKTDMTTDGNDYFDFDRDLNDNWDKIDNAVGDLQGNTADINLSNLTSAGLSQYNVFCVNTGEVDDDGNPAFLNLSDNILTTSGSFDITTANGKIYTVTDTLTLDISDYEDGEYNVYVNPVDLTLSIKSHTLTSGSTFPSDAATGDYLLNTSQVPYDLQEITITTVTDEETEEETTTTTITKGLNEVYAGVLTLSGGVI